MEFKIKTYEIRKLMEIESPEFPKYATQIMNLANRNAQATRPKTVGQMSELIKEFTGRSLKDWEEWYLKRYHKSIDLATEKILKMIDNFKKTIDQIDENMIRKWVRDLVIVKTFTGLRFQEAVLKKIADRFGANYKLSTPEEESKGIDGYIGNIPISLKPITYRAENALKEKIYADIVYYEKHRDSLKITIPTELENKLKQIKSN